MPASAAPRPKRLDAVDWLRGLAVVLMIQTHLYDAWVSPADKLTSAYFWSRFIGGIPARLFMFLVGVSLAIQWQAQVSKGVPRAAMVRNSVKRGLEIVALAYLFRLQEYTLAGFGAHWRDLFRVDILNCIGASMVVVAWIAAPRKGRPQIALSIAAALAFIGLGPIIGPAPFPQGGLLQPLTSYIGGPRPMSWFPIFPWAAWPLLGVAVGHIWARESRDPRRQAWAFFLTGVAGALIWLSVIGIRKIDPYIIRYPSELVQQMGPGSFFYRLGLIGMMAPLALVATRPVGERFSLMRQFGRTSLLVYWIHVDLCYGLISKKLHHKLTMAEATVGLVAMVALMLAVSVAKTRYWEPWRRARARARTAKTT